MNTRILALGAAAGNHRAALQMLIRTGLDISGADDREQRGSHFGVVHDQQKKSPEGLIRMEGNFTLGF